VFALAVTLLIVSLEVPETFNDLWAKMQGFGSFAISFAILFQVWYTQHIFFRRYGLQDPADAGIERRAVVPGVVLHVSAEVSVRPCW